MSRRHDISAFCFILIGVILLISCNMVAKSRFVSFDRETFNASIAKWEETGSGRNYQYIFAKTGFLPVAYRIEVVDGVKTATGIQGGSAGELQLSADNIPRSIEELFDSILNFYEHHNGIVATDNEFYYTGIDVEYDSVYGYPIEIYYDYHVPENMAVDGNFHSSISDFSFIE